MLRAIIIDDEAPARDELAFLLTETAMVEVVGQSDSVRSGIKTLQSTPCDVVFLDINMPEVSGLTLAEALNNLNNPPAVVFVTAYSEYALDAFKVNATDYLQKPVETLRLKQALKKVSKSVASQINAAKNEKIAVERAGKKILIPIESIRFIVARDDYSYLQTDTERFFSTQSLAKFEKKLVMYGFYRVHRGFLVNLSSIVEVSSSGGGTLRLKLEGVEEEVPVSRRRDGALKKELQLQG